MTWDLFNDYIENKQHLIRYIYTTKHIFEERKLSLIVVPS